MSPGEIIVWSATALIVAAIVIVAIFLVPQRTAPVQTSAAESVIDAKGTNVLITGLKAEKNGLTNYERLSYKMSGKDTKVLKTYFSSAAGTLSYFAVSGNSPYTGRFEMKLKGTYTGRRAGGMFSIPIPVRGGKTVDAVALYEGML